MAAVYADLLRAAVEREDHERAMPTVELVRELARQGGASGAGGPRREPGDPVDVVGAVAHELRYDTRLVQLCRRLGVEVDLAAFGRPQAERDRLTGALEALGVLPVRDRSNAAAGSD
ncbi:MAG: hypothetical protein ACRDZR_08745 [Acidimicrobiales bacterium]